MFRSPPSFLEYMSYMFSFQTVLTGPMFIYKDYLSWISNANTGRNGKVSHILMTFFFFCKKFQKIRRLGGKSLEGYWPETH